MVYGGDMLIREMFIRERCLLEKERGLLEKEV